MTSVSAAPLDREPVTIPDELRPAIEAARTEMESRRRLPDDLVAAPRASGIFRLTTPRQYGGFEASLTDVLDVLEALGRIDASVAWTVMNANMGFTAAWLPEDGVKKIWGELDDPFIVNSTRVGANVATPSEGGYLLSGRWDLVSGVDVADWIILFALVPPSSGDEMPQIRVCFVPRSAATILDTWHAAGMRGTGSNSVVADGLFVPAELTFDLADPPRVDRPLYRIPSYTIASTSIAGAVLGIAAAAVDEVVGLAQTKITATGVPLAHQEHLQDAIGRAEAALASARLLVRDLAGAIDRAAAAGDPITAEMRAPLRAAMSHAAEVSRTVLTSMYALGGSSVLYLGDRLEQLVRDGLAGLQHGELGRDKFALAGRVRLGLDPQAPIF